MIEPETKETTGEETLYCTYHPNQPTVLRCNRCGQPICYKCAILTEVGYRCRQCVRSQRAVYYTAHSYDLVIAAVVGLVVSAVAGVLAYAFLGFLGFFSFILAIFVGPAAGGAIAEAVRRSVGRRRAQYMNWVVIVASVVGIALGGVLLYGGQILTGGVPSFMVPSLLARLPGLLVTRIDILIFTFMAASTIYARLQ